MIHSAVYIVYYSRRGQTRQQLQASRKALSKCEVKIMSWQKYRKPLEPGLKLAEIENIPVTVNSVRFAVSEYGELAIMAVTFMETGEKHDVLTSGHVVMDLLNKAKDDLPLNGIFYKEKKYWNIKDVDEPAAVADVTDSSGGDDGIPL